MTFLLAHAATSSELTYSVLFQSANNHFKEKHGINAARVKPKMKKQHYSLLNTHVVSTLIFSSFQSQCYNYGSSSFSIQN